MTTEVMKLRLSELTGETNENILLTFIDMAGEKILQRRYPFSRVERPVPAKYHSVQLEIAAYLLNKRGAEGESVHNENGVNRTYESASVPDSMLKGIVPYAKAFSTVPPNENEEV